MSKLHTALFYVLGTLLCLTVIAFEIGLLYALVESTEVITTAGWFGFGGVFTAVAAVDVFFFLGLTGALDQE